MTTTYPALIQPDADLHTSLQDRDEMVIGRSSAADVIVTDPSVSRRQCRLTRVGETWHLAPISESVPTLHNGQPVTGPTPLTHGSVITCGQSTRLIFEQTPPDAASRSSNAATVQAAPAEPFLPTGSAPAPPRDGQDQTVISQGTGLDTASGLPATPPADNLPSRIELQPKQILGRDQVMATIHLPHPHVSRQHAEITLKNGKAVIRDLKSANGTFVDGLRTSTATTLRPGARLDLGPYAFIFDGTALLTQTVRANNVELVGRNLTRTVKDRQTGKPLVLLDDVTVVLKPREFTCLLGPSGSGKSTLLNALSARSPADQGQVTLNREDLYTNFEVLKPQIAVVPQKDLLHDMLSVGDALRYTARLRLPGDTSSADIEQAVNEMLETVGLTHRKATKIADLSGGQLKRASLANEIIAKPSLLFLDEVTSGLDEQTDREMMQLFREIAEQGKTVACITHSLAHVEENCTHVVILTPGGKLAFVGPPAEALTYFKIDRLGDVYQRLAEKDAQAWRDEFRASHVSATGRRPPAPGRDQHRLDQSAPARLLC